MSEQAGNPRTLATPVRCRKAEGMLQFSRRDDGQWLFSLSTTGMLLLLAADAHAEQLVALEYEAGTPVAVAVETFGRMVSEARRDAEATASPTRCQSASREKHSHGPLTCSLGYGHDGPHIAYHQNDPASYVLGTWQDTPSDAATETGPPAVRAAHAQLRGWREQLVRERERKLADHLRAHADSLVLNGRRSTEMDQTVDLLRAAADEIVRMSAAYDPAPPDDGRRGAW